MVSSSRDQRHDSLGRIDDLDHDRNVEGRILACYIVELPVRTVAELDGEHRGAGQLPTGVPPRQSRDRAAPRATSQWPWSRRGGDSLREGSSLVPVVRNRHAPPTASTASTFVEID